MQAAVISDTHGQHEQIESIPQVPVLIHCGDFTSRGKMSEFVSFAKWFGSLPHLYKLAVPGNHDFCCQYHPDECKEIAKENNFFLGIDESFSLFGKKLYFCPWTTYFGGWAFNATEEELAQIFGKIPEDTEVLVTHGPPLTHGHFLDRNLEGLHCGSNALLNRLPFLTNLEFCLFGHIHEGFGEKKGLYKNPYELASKATFINASLAGGKEFKWTFIDPGREIPTITL